MDKVALSINVGAKKSRVAEGGGCDKKSMATNTGNEHCLRRGLGEAKLLSLSFLMCRYAGATG